MIDELAIHFFITFIADAKKSSEELFLIHPVGGRKTPTGS
jgi:hypothetical protein